MFIPALSDLPGPPVIMFSPLPPTPNGIADYTYEILQQLSRSLSCMVVVDDIIERSRAPNGVAVLTLADYERQEGKLGDGIHVYQIGNNPDHIYMLRVMARRPGLVVLHDPCLHHLLDCATVAKGDFDGYSDALEAEYGASGRILGEQFRAHRLRDQRMFYDMPMIGGLIGPARGVVVHSRYAAVKVLARAPDVDVTIVPHQYSPPPPDSIVSRSDTRRSLGIGDNEIVFLSLGFVTRAKRIEDTLRALASIRNELPPFRYIIAGELKPDETNVKSLIGSLDLDGHVLTLGYVSEADFFSLIQASDVVVNLRHPTGGETSGSMIRCLGSGACVVVVNRGPFAEMPNGSVCKVNWGNGFEARLATALLTLACDPELRRGIAENARIFTLTHNALEATVNGYISAIGRAACRAPIAWRSAAIWESLPPHEISRVNQAFAADPAEAPLPLWFRSGAVLTCEKPCRSAVWGAPLDGKLLAELGHAAEVRPITDLMDGQPDATELRRSFDLVMVQGTAKELEGSFHWIGRINRELAFGGLLVVNVKSTSVGGRHPLQQIESGTELLVAHAFRVDHVTNVGLPELGETRSPLASVEVSDERCWRALKVSEFIRADVRSSVATAAFPEATS